MSEKVKVKATRLGFYNNERKREGAIFFIEPNELGSSWMEEIKDVKLVAPSATPKNSSSPSELVNTTDLQTDLEAKVLASNELTAKAEEARQNLAPNAKQKAITAVETLEAEAKAAYDEAVAAQEALDAALI